MRYSVQLEAARASGWHQTLLDALARLAGDTARFGATEGHDAFAYVLAGGVSRQFDERLSFVDVNCGSGASSALFAFRGWSGVTSDPSRPTPMADYPTSARIRHRSLPVGPRGSDVGGLAAVGLDELTGDFLSSGRIDVMILSTQSQSALKMLDEFSFRPAPRVLVVQRTSRFANERQSLLNLLEGKGYVPIGSDSLFFRLDLFIKNDDPNLRMMGERS